MERKGQHIKLLLFFNFFLRLLFKWLAPQLVINIRNLIGLPLLSIGDLRCLSLETSKWLGLLSKQDSSFVHVEDVDAVALGLTALPRHSEIEPVTVATGVGI